MAKNQKCQIKDDTEDNRFAKILKVTLDLKARHKEQKISRHAFTFSHFDGRKIGNLVLSWLSQFNEYFFEEAFSENDKIKCATYHMTGKASLWWNMQRIRTSRPTTWTKFQEQIKQIFLPTQFHLNARRSWSTSSWIEGKIVTQYTDHFWQRLLLLCMMEDVPKDMLQKKYEGAIQPSIQAKLNSLKPTSLYEAISYAHDVEKEINSITRMIQANQPRPQPDHFNNRPPCWNNNTRYNPNSNNTPCTCNFTPPCNFNAPCNTELPRTNFNPQCPNLAHATLTHTPPQQNTRTTAPPANNRPHGMPWLSPLWSLNFQLPCQ